MVSTITLLALSVASVAPEARSSSLGTVIVFESQEYADELVSTLNWLLPEGTLDVHVCPQSNNCSITENSDEVLAVVGRIPTERIDEFANLKLVQTASYMYPKLSTVPAKVTVANFQGDYNVENIGEFVIAGVFDWQYRLAEKASTFAECAWAADAPQHCPPASTMTNHVTLMDKTMGVLGLGRIGFAVAKRAVALGMRTMATKAHAPFKSDLNLSWIGDDNDKLLRESDFVAVTVPGTVEGLINATAIKLMKPGAVLIPIAANPVDYEALRQALDEARIGAIVDVWDEGCWHYPDYTCGSPYGEPSFPHHVRLDLHAKGRVRTLPGMAMRDNGFWKSSAKGVAENLAALAVGNPLKHVIRAGVTSVSV